MRGNLGTFDWEQPEDWTQVHGRTFWPVFHPDYLRDQRRMLGLARRAWPCTATPVPPAVPFGWRRMKEPYRRSFLYMPAWLYWPTRAWSLRYNIVFEPLIRLGLWQCEDGDFYVEGRPTLPLWLRRIAWCFVNDRDCAPAGMQ